VKTNDNRFTSLIILLALGGAEVAIIYAALVFDTPLRLFANRAADSWPGRVMLASLGWGIISVGMIVLLTIVERRNARARAGEAAADRDSPD
jgi:hypothetical protein